jgi:hypothetical protein
MTHIRINFNKKFFSAIEQVFLHFIQFVHSRMQNCRNSNLSSKKKISHLLNNYQIDVTYNSLRIELRTVRLVYSVYIFNLFN